MTKFRTAYGEDPRPIPGLDFTNSPSMTKQSFKDECDIHTILARYKNTGELPPATREPQYGDFTGVTDFHEALNMVRDLTADFQNLPAKVRDHFHNDPGAFVVFCENPDNEAEMVKLGLANARPPDEHLGPEGPPATPEADKAPPAPAEGSDGGKK